MSALRARARLSLAASVAVVVVAAFAALAVPSTVFAQSPRDLIVDSLRSQFGVDEAPVSFTADEVPIDPFAARAPFGPGERLVYKVKVGVFGVGEGYLSVLGVDDHADGPAYHVAMNIDGGLGPLKVFDTYQTWFDVTTLQSRRFIQDINDPGYSSYRFYEMFDDRMRWERQDNDEAGDLGSALPLDDIAFIYFVRTLPLEVGKVYTLNRYFKDTGNPVVVRVLRKDRRETEGVWYNTIVVAPEIRTRGLFDEGGNAEIHFTDDERRIPVYVRSNIKGFPGSLTLHLRSIQEGQPLHPDARSEAEEARAARATQAPPSR